MQLAKRIRALRYVRGMGFNELARRAGISKSALRKIETGECGMPRIATLSGIARALGVPLYALTDPKAKIRDVEGHDLNDAVIVVQAANPPAAPADRPPGDRTVDLEEKLRALLASPLAEGITQILEDSFRLTTNNAPPADGYGSGYAAVIEVEMAAVATPGPPHRQGSPGERHFAELPHAPMVYEVDTSAVSTAPDRSTPSSP